MIVCNRLRLGSVALNVELDCLLNGLIIPQEELITCQGY